MKNYRKWIIAIVFLGLWAAFWGFGVRLHQSCAGVEPNFLGWVSIDGYDSEGYLCQFIDMRSVLDLNSRHPVLRPLLLPVFAVASSLLDNFGPEAAKIGVLGFFAFVGAVNTLLLYLVLGRLGVGARMRIGSVLLWLSFSHVWLLGGMAESFALSIALLLSAVYLQARGVRDERVWLALAALTSGVTLTNGVKTLIAWRPERRQLVRVVCWCAAAAAVVPFVLAAKWVLVNHMTVTQGFFSIVDDARLGFIGLTLRERLWYFWQAFLCDPICLHGPIISVDSITSGYPTVWPTLAVALVLACAAVGAVLNRRHPVVRTVLLFVACDVALHVVVGWGLHEGQIYCGHWFWSLPLFVALLPKRFDWVPFALTLCVAMCPA